MNHEILTDALMDLPDRFIGEAAGEASPHRAARGVRQVLAVAAALILLVGLGVPALAAGNEAFNDALYRVFPGLAQAMKPVQLSCENNGICMEVISAQVEDGTARVYLSIRDLTGDRIDETVDLFDSYHMNLPARAMSGHCEQIAYDPETRTATFLCTLEGWDAAKLSNKVTFSLGCFISGKRTVTGDVMTFVPAELGEGTLWQGVRPRGYGYTGEKPPAEMLTPLAAPLAVPAEGVQVTGLAYANGLLHVQHHYDDVKRLDIHGFPIMLDPEGREASSQWNISAFDGTGAGSYEDNVYAIPADDTGVYTIRGEYVIASRYVEGCWQVTFPVGE